MGMLQSGSRRCAATAQHSRFVGGALSLQVPGCFAADGGACHKLLSGQLPPDPDGCLFQGEQSLHSSVKHVSGVLLMAYLAKELAYQCPFLCRKPMLPRPHWWRASMFDVCPVDTLDRLVA